MFETLQPADRPVARGWALFITYIKAKFPAGATTGYVTVTTPSGTVISNVPFHVIP